jgi:hypothetical protein
VHCLFSGSLHCYTYPMFLTRLLPGSADSRRAVLVGPARNQVLCSQNRGCEKDHQWHLFLNQDDNNTGKNTCQASSALAVRLRRIYTFSP